MDNRITFRLDPKKRELLEKAADKVNRNLSNFIATAAVAAAKRVLGGKR